MTPIKRHLAKTIRGGAHGPTAAMCPIRRRHPPSISSSTSSHLRYALDLLLPHDFPRDLFDPGRSKPKRRSKATPCDTQRHELDEYEASRERLKEWETEAAAAEGEDLSAESADKSRGRPKDPRSASAISRATGVPQRTVQDTRRHVEAGCRTGYSLAASSDRTGSSSGNFLSETARLAAAPLEMRIDS